MAFAKKTTTIVIKPPKLEVAVLTVKGTRLLMHKWSEKAKAMMLRKSMGLAEPTDKRPNKDPHQDAIDTTYFLGDVPKTWSDFEAGYKTKYRVGMPAVNFKCAIVHAATQAQNVTKVFLRGAFFVEATHRKLVEVKTSMPRLDEQMVRVGMGVADIRHRTIFDEWTAKLRIRYNSDTIKIGDIANLLNLAGFCCGIGDYRAEKDGDCGAFSVVAS
jgi:hypothetical protein